MSASEDLHEIIAQSAEGDPVEALRDALGDILAGLVAAGCGPHHLRGMIWETDRPEAFHLSRHTVELAYRETFAGFRPPVRLVPRAEPGLTIRARHAAAQPLPDTLVDGYFLVREADALGLDADSLHVSGHSAGGHLAAMTLCAPDVPPIASALLLSGLYHLNPLGHLPLGRLLGLDDAARATRLSPIDQPRPGTTRIAFAVGEGESDAFKAQSAALAAAWQTPAPLICPGHHFSMLEGLNGGALLDLALRTAEGR